MVDVLENCKIVSDRVAQAATRAGRGGAEVSIVAVTKTRSVPEIDAAIAGLVAC